ARIDRVAGDADFVVQVRAGRAAGRADVTDQLALGDLLPRRDRIARQVRITGLDLPAMLDLDIVAVAAEALGLRDDAVGRGVNRGAGRLREVDALVVAAAAEHRMRAHAVVAGQVGRVERHPRGNRNRSDRSLGGNGAGSVDRLPAGEQLGELAIPGGG